MKKNKKKIICIIPARGGSERIKNKNIIDFYGKPLIYYSIKAAKKSNIFSRIIVKKYGAEVPFLRNKKLSDDKTSTMDVLIDTIRKIDSTKVDFHCLLYPTAPLINSKDISSAYNKLQRENADALMTVSKYLNHPLRSLIIKNKYLKFKWKKYQKTNSQELEELFHDCGNFYFFKTSKILNKKKFYPKKMIPYKIKIYNSVDIDNYEDLKLAKKLFQN